MILADKIIKLRRKNALSQEEFAQKLGVSRQAVSKWESAQSVPDVQKILEMARMFSVTTDYLLRDDMETEEFSSQEQDDERRKLTLEEANKYLLWIGRKAVLIAVATFLWFVAVIPIITLTPLSVRSFLGLSEEAAVFIGLLVLFLIGAASISVYIFCGFKNEPFSFLDKERFDVEYGVVGMAKSHRHKSRVKYVAMNIIGSVLCVLSPLSLFASIFATTASEELIGVIALDFTLLMVGAGVLLFIISGVKEGSYKRILSEGDFSDEGKRKNRLEEKIGAIYWPIIVAIYLAVSFITGAWHISWIIWPVSAAFAGAIMAVCSRIFGMGDK